MYMDEFRLGHGAQSTDRERERGKEESSYSSHGDCDARDGPTKEGRYTAEGVEVVPSSGGMVKLLSIPQASQISFTLPLQPF